jgi:uncharacterized protein with FMN-binding domain
MRRALPAIVVTAVGLVALASFRSTSGLPTKSAGAVIVPGSTTPASSAPPRGSGTSAPTTKPPSATNPPDTGGPTPTAPATTPQTSPPTTPQTSGGVRTITGDTYDTQYGPVQVQVTLRGRTITAVTALQLPDSHRRSIEISSQAEPLLRQEALQAQSAQIDLLSGATFTSEGYAQSLQSALDKAGA